jgi:hypothetical protein
MLVPPSIVSEVSTNADATLTPTARDKLDLRAAKQNVNLCRAHGSGCGHCRYRTRGFEQAAQSGAGCAGPEKDNPQEPPPGERAGEPALFPGRLGPWGSSVPRGTPTTFPSLARESSRPTTRKPREPHRRNSGWRHPPPSGSPSRPVGPSGRNPNPDFPVRPRRPLGAQRNLEGGRGRVKATFPLARRVCPASSG